jgi:hypothetical protein
VAERGHQVDVAPPERGLVGSGLRDVGRAAREIAAGQRPLPEDVAQAIAEAIAQLRHFLVRRAAVGTRVAAVFDQRDVAVVGAEAHGRCASRPAGRVGGCPLPGSLREWCDPEHAKD